MISSAKSKQRPGPSEVAQTVRRYIADKGLSAGERLPTHEELSEMLDVGVRRLREGLSILRQEGRIETKRKGGTVVRSPSVKAFEEPIRWHLEDLGCEFPDLVRARAALESAAAGEAARARTARDLLALLDSIEQMEATQPPRHEEMDEAFHLALLECTHNPALLVFGKLIAGQFQCKKTRVRLDLRSAWRRSNRQHRVIYEAIERGDCEAARQGMHEHVLEQLKEVAGARKTAAKQRR